MIRPATPDDVPAIAQLIRDLAEYERLADKVVLQEPDLREHLFGPRRYCEVLLAEDGGSVVGFALFFHNYSTFLGKPGIYLEGRYGVRIEDIVVCAPDGVDELNQATRELLVVGGV